MKLINYITEMLQKGRYTFTMEEVLNALGTSRVAARNAIYRLKNKNILAEPKQGFYVIVPPEYQKWGCLPADQFVPELMSYLKLPYYVGLLSAAQFYGAAHQQPQIFQVVTKRNLPMIHCGKIRIMFIANKMVGELPIQQFKTPRGMLIVASPETTALDLIMYPHRSGGMNNILSVLVELAAQMKPASLQDVIKHSANYSWLQRLGYLLEYVGAERLAEVVEQFLRKYRTRPRALLESESIKDAKLNSRWNILVNVDLENEL